MLIEKTYLEALRKTFKGIREVLMKSRLSAKEDQTH